MNSEKLANLEQMKGRNMKKLILTVAVVALAGMGIQSAKAGVSLNISVGARPAGYVAIGGPGYYVPAAPYYPAPVCAPVVYPRPVAYCPPPVVIVRPPVYGPAFVAVRPGHYGDNRFSRGHHQRW